MILVRSIFQCEPGRVQEFVERFKAMGERMDTQDVLKRSRILTDLTGRFDTVVVESEIESMDAYFAMLEASFADQEVWDEPAALAYRAGSREFYTIEATLESSS